MNHRSLRLTFLGAAVVIAASASLALRSSHVSGQKVPGLSPVPVTTTKVARADVPVEPDALGRVTGLTTVTIRPQVGGQVSAIKFKDGQYVQQGDVLVQIDPRPLQAAVARRRVPATARLAQCSAPSSRSRRRCIYTNLSGQMQA